jgi:hypothetical protein
VAKFGSLGSLIYATCLGGGGSDNGMDIDADADGNVYITGVAGSSSFDFPTTADAFQPNKGGFQDAFMTKLDPTGSFLVYSTFLGGSDIDKGYGIAVDAERDIYVTGETFSVDFPTTEFAFDRSFNSDASNRSDAFVSKFTIGDYMLTVNKTGTGSGKVMSSPPGIDCGTVCSESYPYGTTVILGAQPDPDSKFDGWSGDCTGTEACVVSMTEARSVTATFTTGSYLLTVSKAGTGSGGVTSNPSGINCGSDCSESYTYGTTVTLTATPDPDSRFEGWSGDCSGTGSCVVTGTEDRSVTASFFVIEGASLWIEPPETTLYVSTNSTVDVMVSDVTDLYGIELEITFDPTFVEVVDNDSGTPGIQIQPGICPSPDFVVVNSADNTTGTISYAATSLSPSPPCDGGGVIASITFHGLVEGPSPVHFDSWLLSDTDLNSIHVGSMADGRLQVLDPIGTIESTVDLQGRADESGAEVCAWQGGVEVECTVTDEAGYYSFTLQEGTYDVTIEMARYLDAEKAGQVVVAGGTTTLCQVKLLGGDASDDDVINILDLSFMGYRFGSCVGDPDYDPRADINNDGCINILDIVAAGVNFNKTSPVPWPCP